MSFFGPCTIKGGLPAWAEVSFGKDSDTPNGPGDYWAEVENIFWMKRDGSMGAPVSEKVFDEAMAYDESGIIEAVQDHLVHEQWLKENP